MKNKVRILNFQEIAKGIKLCLNNAKDLIEEAQLLHDKEKYRGSLVFSLFAWEECAKISQIFNLSEPINFDDVKIKWRHFVKKFHSHEKKLIGSLTNKIIRDIEETGGSNFKNIIKEKPSKRMPDLITIKTACLYVNCDINKKEFIVPYKISEDISADIIEEVRKEIEVYKQFDDSAVADIENALKLYAGDKYWKDRPFEASSNEIKNKLEGMFKGVNE